MNILLNQLIKHNTKNDKANYTKEAGIVLGIGALIAVIVRTRLKHVFAILIHLSVAVYGYQTMAVMRKINKFDLDINDKTKLFIIMALLSCYTVWGMFKNFKALTKLD